MIALHCTLCQARALHTAVSWLPTTSIAPQHSHPAATPLPRLSPLDTCKHQPSFHVLVSPCCCPGCALLLPLLRLLAHVPVR